MAVQTLDASLNMSPVTVGDGLLWRGQETCAGEQNGSDYGDSRHQQDQQEQADSPLRLDGNLV
jgi:hypothetical protein